MEYNTVFLKLLSFCLIASSAAQNSKYKYLGCFLGENLLSLGDESLKLTPISPQTCSTYCVGKQFTFFILRNDTCYCSNDYISVLMKQRDTDCTFKCTGDNMSICGGPQNYVSFYLTDETKFDNYQKPGFGCPIPIYLGCYSESTGNRLLKGIAQNYNSKNTPRICSEMCFSMGYLYFGVTDGSECWCGNQQPSKSSKVDEKQCNSPCKGDKKLMCGGKWKMGIYSTGITDYEPKKYIGCFKDEKNITETYSSYKMQSNNSPKRCMNLCNTQQFKYAAVKGDVCECKSYEPDYKFIKSQSDCDNLCSENPSEYCGGGTTLRNVYSTIYSDPRGDMKMNSIGCFKSSTRHPTLNGWKINGPRLIPEDCVQSCYERRFPYAAIAFSKECSCSTMKPFAGAKIEDKMCSNPCIGATCDIINTINVYGTGLESKTDTIGNYYIGCFEENQKNRIFTNFSKSFLAINTAEYCSNICFKNGYTYSGVTNMSECYCGNHSPNENINRKLDDKQCNSKCTGDASQFCGGTWRMGIFVNGLNESNIYYQYVGCFVQDNAFRKKKFVLANTNTPRTCSAICSQAAYLFAGVVGMDCLCSNEPPNISQKLDETKCNSLCTGDSRQMCGGNDKIQIYNLRSSNIMINTGNASYYHDSPGSIVISTTTTYLPPTNTSVLPMNRTIEQSSSKINTSQVYTGDYDFLNINSYWNHEIYIPQEPDFEFTFYNNSDKNVYVDNKELIIKPTIITSKKLVMKGSLKLNGCTKNDNYGKCAHTAESFNILPPVMSAKLTTKKKMILHNEEIEVVAKLPTGDWIVTEIALVSKNNDKNKIVLLSKGNVNLKCNGDDESANTLKLGLQLDEKSNKTSSLKVVSAPISWSENYHTFQLLWGTDNFIFKIDGQEYRFNLTKLHQNIFSSENYLSIGVSVGGMINFPDKCLSNGHLKPWKNSNYKSMFHFFNDMDNWAPTWNDEISKLRIKSVKYKSVN